MLMSKRTTRLPGLLIPWGFRAPAMFTHLGRTGLAVTKYKVSKKKRYQISRRIHHKSQGVIYIENLGVYSLSSVSCPLLVLLSSKLCLSDRTRAAQIAWVPLSRLQKSNVFVPCRLMCEELGSRSCRVPSGGSTSGRSFRVEISRISLLFLTWTCWGVELTPPQGSSR